MHLVTLQLYFLLHSFVLLIGASISCRCFFKDGSSNTPCMEFRVVTHMQGSTVSNLKFQCMTERSHTLVLK